MVARLTSPVESMSEIWVAVGPSVANLKDQLAASLGSDFSVVDFLSRQRPQGDQLWVAVLGTTELPEGKVVAQKRGREGRW